MIMTIEMIIIITIVIIVIIVVNDYDGGKAPLTKIMLMFSQHSHQL